jgi:transposase-like protein
MESFAKAAIQNPSIGWQIQYYLMDSRLACQLQNYEYARTRAEEAVSLATSSGMDLLTIEAKNTLAMVLFRTNQLVLAEKHLQDALQMNHDGLRQTDHGDLSQPALCGVSLLYLARVELLKGEKMLALRTLHEWRNISHRVEHKWVKNLAAEVEQQAVHQCLTEYVNADAASMDFPRQLLLLRKVSIERASRKLGSTKIVDIAKELNVNRQTVHSWLKELRKELMPASI